MKYFLSLTILLFLQVGYSQKTIPLYEGLVPNNKPTSFKDSIAKYGDITFMTRIVNPELTIYLPQKNKSTGIAVIICPGGGYSGLAIDHEGHDIAKKLQANGISGFVLKYRMPKSELVDNKEFVPLQDAQQAIKMVRENATKWNINPRKIGIQGNSAGGHLASTAGTHFMKEQITNSKKTSLRPDFLILNYPVISFADSITHAGSRFNLIGEMSPEDLNKIMGDWKNAETRLRAAPVNRDKVFAYSNELQVTKDTPPAFITHAMDDDVVPIENALLFAAALHQNKIPVETYFYAKGGHGYGMINPTASEQWIDNCIKWILKFK